MVFSGCRTIPTDSGGAPKHKFSLCISLFFFLNVPMKKKSAYSPHSVSLLPLFISRGLLSLIGNTLSLSLLAPFFPRLFRGPPSLPTELALRLDWTIADENFPFGREFLLAIRIQRSELALALDPDKISVPSFLPVLFLVFQPFG